MQKKQLKQTKEMFVSNYEFRLNTSVFIIQYNKMVQAPLTIINPKW